MASSATPVAFPTRCRSLLNQAVYMVLRWADRLRAETGKSEDPAQL